LSGSYHRHGKRYLSYRDLIKALIYLPHGRETVSWLRLISYQLSMIIGIDNGACSGAAVAISSWDGAVIGYTRLPSHKVGKKTELDMIRFRDWVLDFKLPPVNIVIEEPLHHAPSSQSMRSMAMCYGQLIGLCTGMAWPWEGLPVREWQRDMLGKFPKGMSKKYALAKAKELAPEEQWFATARSQKPHDGIVDAYLMATREYEQNYKN